MARSEVGTLAPALHVWRVFPVQTPDHCSPLPHVNGATVCGVLSVSLTPCWPSALLPSVALTSADLPFWVRVRPTLCRGFPQGVAHYPYLIPELPISEEPTGPPKFLCASLHAYHTLMWTPAAPSETLPKRSLCVGFCRVKNIAICMSRNEAVSSFGECGSLLRSTRFPCVRFNCIVRLPSFTAATLGMSGWLGLTQ